MFYSAGTVTMQPMVRAAILAVAAVWPALGPVAGMAQEIPELQNSTVEIAYMEPLNPAHRAIYDRLRQRQVLEQLRQFLAPLELPRKLLVKIEGCRGVVNAWYSNDAVTLCYEYIDFIRGVALKGEPPQGFAREDAIVGPFVDVVFHELAHAVFDMLKIPILGREEDAADQVAAFLLMQFGKNVARRTLSGTAYFYGAIAAQQSVNNDIFADVHGTHAQRFFNTLCIAYGGDPNTFNDFVQKGLLPRHRVASCPYEYQQVQYAFGRLILPKVNQHLMKLVQSRDWLRPEDGLDSPPPNSPITGDTPGPAQ
ncbi:MAG: hypothetical protein QOI12_3350 [Alphaproteobacteria bacterium]|jgi:hypothetical protein|nr:hypothetical protein [Alphaproteobacteria bacterium]